MKQRKGTSFNDLQVEMVQAHGGWDSEKITKLLNKIHNSGTILNDFCHAVFITILAR